VDDTPPAADPGSLVSVTMASRLGVVLDEFPAAMRDRVATSILAKDTAFWEEGERVQMRMTGVRLVYRRYYGVVC